MSPWVTTTKPHASSPVTGPSSSSTSPPRAPRASCRPTPPGGCVTRSPRSPPPRRARRRCPVSEPTSQRITGGQQYALALAVAGMLAVGAYGLVISYWTVRELAVKLHMPLPHIFPIGIEGGMIAVLAIDIVLTWIGRPITWLRQV